MNYKKLETWRKLDGEIKRLKDEEMSLRKELFAETFAEKEGAQSIELDGGWSLSASLPFIRTLDQEKAPDLVKALKKTHPALIKTKYELSVAEYRTLDENAATLVNAALTTKPGAPSLKLVPPKGSPA